MYNNSSYDITRLRDGAHTCVVSTKSSQVRGHRVKFLCIKINHTDIRVRAEINHRKEPLKCYVTLFSGNSTSTPRNANNVEPYFQRNLTPSHPLPCYVTLEWPLTKPITFCLAFVSYTLRHDDSFSSCGRKYSEPINWLILVTD